MRTFVLLFSFLGWPMLGLAEPVPYIAPFWLPGGDLQTLYSAFFASTPEVDYRRERWELADGDFIDVDWVESKAIISNQPTVVLFHGLEGSSQSPYAKSVMAATLAKGWRGVIIHFRGCSGEPNRLPRVYYASDTPEIEMLLSRVRKNVPLAPIFAVGFSLGGNALLKWLGESGEHANTIIDSAVAVSAPMDLAATPDALGEGLNRYLYTPSFVNSTRLKALNLLDRFPGIIDEEKIKSAKTIRDIDNAVTAVLYGAADANDYYAKNASKPWLKRITLPTLILNAKNDPFIPSETLPKPAEISAAVTLEYPETGGHVGFFGRKNWLPNRLLDFFTLVNNQTFK